MRGEKHMTKTELKHILVNARKEKNLTHEQVASLTGNRITRQYYGMIENGERTPSVDVAKSIAKVLEMNWTIFFDARGNQTLQNNKRAI